MEENKMEQEQLKNEIIELLKSTKREGMPALITHLEEKGFFTSPASTKWHGNYPGGLAEHSYSLYKMFLDRCNEFNLINDKSFGVDTIRTENIIIISLLHDACKVGAYLVDRNLIRYNKSMPPGHATISLGRVKEFIQLEPIE